MSLLWSGLFCPRWTCLKCVFTLVWKGWEKLYSVHFILKSVCLTLMWLYIELYFKVLYIVHIDLSDLEEIWRKLTSVQCLSFLDLDVGEFQMHHQFVSFQGKGPDNSWGLKEGTQICTSFLEYVWNNWVQQICPEWFLYQNENFTWESLFS